MPLHFSILSNQAGAGEYLAIDHICLNFCVGQVYMPGCFHVILSGYSIITSGQYEKKNIQTIPNFNDLLFLIFLLSVKLLSGISHLHAQKLYLLPYDINNSARITLNGQGLYLLQLGIPFD